MKDVMVSTLKELMKNDENLYLLTGDLGYPYFLEIGQQFPGRFINMGVAEQNMVSVAAGLAITGQTVFIYSISTFATLRCLEQIRHDLCYHHLNVNILGYGGGFTYSAFGVTHYGWEDVALMRSLPNMHVYSPGTTIEAKRVIRKAYHYSGPAYIRLAKLINKTDVLFQMLQPDSQSEMHDVTVFVSGPIVANVLQAKQFLANLGISLKVISVPVIKPLDSKKIIGHLKSAKAVITVEEHTIIGGLGSAIAELITVAGLNGIRFKAIALPDKYPKIVGSSEYLLNYHGLSPNKITKTIYQFLSNKAVLNQNKP